MEIGFSKLHALGNDFVVVNELDGTLIRNKRAFAKAVCQRRLSVGADGVLFLCKSSKDGNADFKMRIFNADGSEAENCVNGLRCAALEKHLLDGCKKSSFVIETLAGKANARIASFGEGKAVIEVEFLGVKRFLGKHSLEINGRVFDYFFIDVGNPHAVFFLSEPVEGFPVEEIGHRVEYHERFSPHRTNAEFVNVVSHNSVRMRVHERGCCETLACGSGSIAVVIAGVNARLLDKAIWVKVKQPGGTIEINFDGNNVLVKAEAKKVFDGALHLRE